MTYDTVDEHPGGHVTISDARQEFADIVNRVAYGGERVRLVRHGRAVAALIPIDDLDQLERMEDEQDLVVARETLGDPTNAVPIPWEEVKREIGF